MLTAASWASPKAKPARAELWEMSLDGGRKLTWERNLKSESEVKPNRGFWNKVVDVIAGAPDYRFLVRPYSIATDSRGRVIVTDPGASGVHIFDFAQKKYKFIERKEKTKDAMTTPQCVAVDAQDNIYVTDSDTGKIFVFEPSGKYVRAIGSLKGGEGYFKRPTGIAVDSAAQRIYVTDTLRDQIFVLDMQGNILQTIGKSGEGNGEFNLPTELRLNGPDLLVVDAMNFRVQVFDRSGKFQYAIGKIGDSDGRVIPAEGGRASTPKATSTLSMLCGAWCRSSIDRGSCSITLALRARMQENFSCPPGCSSTAMTRCLSSTRSTAGCRYFSMLA